MDFLQATVEKGFMDDTKRTYINNYELYRADTKTAISGGLQTWIDDFTGHIPMGGSIFELGSATGDAARYFARHGFTVMCTDIIPQALEERAAEGFPVAEYDFRDVPNPYWLNTFDAYYANAVLIHATNAVLVHALTIAAHMLKRHGIAGLVFKTGSGDAVTHSKMNGPRYFNYQSKESMRKIFAQIPEFRILDMRLLNDPKRGAAHWLHIVAKRR